MNSTTYRIISSLLSFSLLSFLVVQGFWLRNTFKSKEEDFNRLVYAAMEEVADKLQYKRDLSTLRMHYIIEGGDTLIKTPARNRITITSGDSVLISSKTEKNQSVTELHLIKDFNKKTIAEIHRKTKHAGPIIYMDSLSVTSSVKAAGNSEQLRLENVIKKLIGEAVELDAEAENTDSVKAIINRALLHKGVATEFEFKYLKGGTADRELARSPAFDSSATSFESDLSAKLLLPSKHVLHLQFPHQQNVILTNMKSALVFSSIFTLLMLIALLYSFHLIRKQKQISELRNDFINNMTHELKTPIATSSLALANLKVAEEKKDTEKTLLYMHILQEENDKMNRHVERVLQLSLLDNPKLQLQTKVFDLNTVVTRALNNFKLRAELEQRELEFVPDKAACLMKGDDAQMELVINNLIDNAFKYSTFGSPIQILTVRHLNQIVLSVTDKGNGIEKRDQQKVFERFQRIPTGDLHEVKGFGLGLSFVKQIVELHGGFVEVESTPKEGSSFIIHLPSHA